VAEGLVFAGARVRAASIANGGGGTLPPGRQRTVMAQRPFAKKVRPGDVSNRA
jgi:hypothetical protein